MNTSFAAPADINEGEARPPRVPPPHYPQPGYGVSAINPITTIEPTTTIDKVPNITPITSIDSISSVDTLPESCWTQWDNLENITGLMSMNCFTYTSTTLPGTGMVLSSRNSLDHYFLPKSLDVPTSTYSFLFYVYVVGYHMQPFQLSKNFYFLELWMDKLVD